MKRQFVITYVIMGIVLISILIFFVVGNGGENISSGEGGIIEKLFGNSGSPNENNAVPNTVASTNSEPSSSSGGGDGGNGGGSSESSSEGESNSTNCRDERVSYALRQFNENIICLEYNEGNCVDLSANCSVELQNLDSAISGDFTIKFILYDGEENKLKDEEVVGFVSSGEKRLFFNEFRITSSSGVDGPASCNFNTVVVPIRRICN